MKRTIIFLVLVAGLIIFYRQVSLRKNFIEGLPASSVSTSPIKNESPAFKFQDEFTKVVANALPAVCNVSASYIIEMKSPMYFEDFFFFPFEDFFEMPRRRPKKQKFKQEATGSGVIISEDGLVLTNEHVVRNADEIKVTVYIGGKEKIYPAKILGKDFQTDIAVLKIKSNKKFHYLPLGNSSKIKVGEFVFAIGSPFGLAQTVTSGIISAERQNVRVEDRIYEDVIQTDAAINRGNSGGPLINLKGEIIGINSAIVAPAGGFIGVGFAIPINKAKEILDDLIEKGEVSRGWLGIEMREIDEVVKKQFGLKEKSGVLINRVLDGSPAQEAGLERGDVILEFDGKKIEDMFHLKRLVQKKKPGSRVNLKVFRDGKILKFTVKLGRKEGEKIVASEKEFEWEGIKVRNLTQDEKSSVSSGRGGVFVISVDYSKKLGNSGVIAGDIICAVNRKNTPDVATFRKVVKKVNIEEGVFFDIVRNGLPMYITFIP